MAVLYASVSGTFLMFCLQILIVVFTEIFPNFNEKNLKKLVKFARMNFMHALDYYKFFHHAWTQHVMVVFSFLRQFSIRHCGYSLVDYVIILLLNIAIALLNCLVPVTVKVDKSAFG